MTTNVDNRPGAGAGGMPPRFHYTSQTSFASATFIAAAQTPYAPNTFVGQLGTTQSAAQPTLNIVPNVAGTYNFNIGNLPYGSRILRAYAIQAVNWAGATVNTSIGNASGGAQIVAAATTGFAATLGTSALALVASAAQYVETVDFTPIWVSVVVSAGTLTGGQTDIVLEYATTHGPQGQF